MTTSSDPDISPTAKEVATAALSHIKAMASGKPPATPSPSGGSGSGNSSSSGSSGSSGSANNNSPGGNHPLGNPPSSDGELNNGSPQGGPDHGGTLNNLSNMSAKQWVLFVAVLISTGCTLWLLAWRTSDKGVEITTQNNAVMEKEVDLKIAKERTRQIQAVAASGTQVPASMISAPVSSSALSSPLLTPANCQSVGEGDGATRSTAIPLSFGQCLAFKSGTAKQVFWVTLNSSPKGISGKASFNHMREETDADKVERKARCMAQTNDVAYCDAEMQKKVGVRVDHCLTKDSPDTCLGYVKGKINLPLVVHSDESVTITMN
jgi:hypothetical protein